jgi:hypothetical protein
MTLRPFVFAIALGVLAVASAAPAERPVPLCACDCDRDFAVGIDEMITAVQMALASAPLQQCRAADANGDGSVDIADLVRGVGRALHGCAVALGEACPDACTGGCAAGMCVIACDATSECQNDRLACPAGMPCRIQCDGISSCQGSQFFCPEDADCILQCTNTSSCQGVYLVCGEFACGATCSGAGTNVNAVICGDASTCNAECEQLDPCTAGIDCPDDPCFGVFCGRGACAVEAGAPHCVCDEGYVFDTAFGRCLPTPMPCDGVDCSGHGECVAAEGQATCTCDSGYVAMGLQCLPSTMCPEPSTPPEVCPAACSGGCVDDVCVIACRDTSACQNDVLTCPDDMACRIECAGLSACQSAQFVCSGDAACDIQCSNTSACQGGYVTCGGGACSVSCSGPATSVDSVQCGESCACANTCTELHHCMPGTDCPGDPCFDTFCGRGHCVVDGGAPHCECDEGYVYDESLRRCWPAPMPCQGITCSGHGTCSVIDAHAVCTCDEGFVAMGLGCVAADQCPPTPPPPASCPEACSGGCIDGVCVIDCGGLSACRGTLECPDGIACRVECAGISSCQNTHIVCPADAPCDVQCSNTSACQGSQVTCGAGACTASCTGTSTSTALQCGASCACHGCGAGY